MIATRRPPPERLAAWCGYTRRLEAEYGGFSLTLAIAPDTDLDGEFKAICLDTGAVLTVQGWLLP